MQMQEDGDEGISRSPLNEIARSLAFTVNRFNRRLTEDSFLLFNSFDIMNSISGQTTWQRSDFSCPVCVKKL